MVKVFLDATLHPWVTWDKQLWVELNSTGPHSFEIVTKRKDADIIFKEWYPQFDYDCIGDNTCFLYVDSIEDNEIKKFKKGVTKSNTNIIIVCETSEVAKVIEGLGFGSLLWRKPMRVPEKMFFNGSVHTGKNENIITVSNASRYIDKYAEVVKAYFNVCLEDTEHGLDAKNNLEMFSAQEPPIEPFNNVHFNGLQPNPALFKEIQKSKLFISPYDGNGIPISAIDAVYLGTPILVRDTPVNRRHFHWDSNLLFSGYEDLSRKIKYYNELDISSEEYYNHVERNFNSIADFSVKSSLNNLNRIIDLLYESKLVKG